MRTFILCATLAGAACVAASPVATRPDGPSVPTPMPMQKREGATQKYFKVKVLDQGMTTLNEAELKTTYIGTMTIPAEGEKIETKIPYLVATGTVDLTLTGRDSVVTETAKPVAAVKFMHYQSNKITDLVVALDNEGHIQEWHPSSFVTGAQIYSNVCIRKYSTTAICHAETRFPGPGGFTFDGLIEEVTAEVVPLDQASDVLKDPEWVRQVFNWRYTLLNGDDDSW